MAVPPNACFHCSTVVARSSLTLPVLLSVLPLASATPASPLPVQSARASPLNTNASDATSGTTSRGREYFPAMEDLSIGRQRAGAAIVVDECECFEADA